MKRARGVSISSENFAVDHRCLRSYHALFPQLHPTPPPSQQQQQQQQHSAFSSKMAKKNPNSRQGNAIPRRAVKPAKGKPYQRNSRAVATVQRPRQENNLTDGQSELVDACTNLQLSPPRRKIPTHQKVLQAMKRDKQNIEKMPRRQQRLIFFLYSRGFLPKIKNNKEQSQIIRHLVFSSTSAEHKRLSSTNKHER